MKLGLLEIVKSLVEENGVTDKEIVETVCFLIDCSEKTAALRLIAKKIKDDLDYADASVL